MSTEKARPVLKPLQALHAYHESLHLYKPDGQTPLVLPGVIGTVFFERGSKPEVRAGILKCFDRFEELFGKELKGGKAGERGKFSRKTAQGLATLRREIIETPAHLRAEVVRSSATDQDMAAEYEIGTLTNRASPIDDHDVHTGWSISKGEETSTSYLKFSVPMSLITDAEGLAVYESFLRFVCHSLPVYGGYGGLSPILPYSYHRFMPMEYELAKRFSGLEIDSRGFSQHTEYEMVSYEGERGDKVRKAYGYLKPGAKVSRWGFIKSVNWYTLLGDVFVGRLGGEEKLRAALGRSDIGIERIGQCVLIRAGEFPRLGAPEEGLPEPYVFVNSVLRVLRNPQPDSLHLHIPSLDHADLKETRHWEARFDLPGAPPIPPPPEIVPPPTAANAPDQLAAYADEPCPQTGDWQAPRLANRIEHVERGQPMPGPKNTQTGAVVWYLVDGGNQACTDALH